jgi:phosphotransferase system HPr (HPr) family protein
MQQRTVTVQNRLGLHARAAARLVRLANSFSSEIQLARSDAQHRAVDARSILGVLMLAATQFTELKIIVEGGDEEAAIEALCALIEGECGEA